MISNDTYAGRPIQFGNRQIVPFSKRLHIQIPGQWGFVLWERPVSLLVTEEDGNEDIVPVIDFTRYIILGLFGPIIILWLIMRKYHR